MIHTCTCILVPSVQCLDKQTTEHAHISVMLCQISSTYNVMLCPTATSDNVTDTGMLE